MNKAVVFGGSGFIGSHLVDLLLEKGFEVVNVDVKQHCNHNSKDTPKYQLVRSSVCLDHTEGVRRLFDNFKPDIVFNFVATADIEECEQKPLKSFFNNAGTNAIIVESFKCLSDCLYVFASSVYAGSDYSGFYGISKKSSEAFIRHYFRRDSSNNNYLILRYGTVYGPRATKENGIRRLVEGALNTKVISHYGTGEESREYIHVRDCARNTFKLCNTMDYWNSIVKITGNSSVKSKQLVLLIKEILGDDYQIEFRKQTPVDHYLSTPYRYVKKDIVNFVNNDSIDLGAGLVEVIRELDNDK